MSQPFVSSLQQTLLANAPQPILDQRSVGPNGIAGNKGSAGATGPDGQPGAPGLTPASRLMPVSARAGIVVTGTEVLTGRVQDRNGPWIADRLLELGVELAHITICGDRPADIEAQLRFMADQGVDLIVTSGGLGPTADDMTVEVVARFAGRELVLDDEVENKIANILKRLMGAATPPCSPAASTRSGPPTASRP